MVFFNGVGNPHPKVTERDRDRAKCLRLAVTAKRRRVPNWSPSSWANEFRLLLGELNGDEEYLDKVLTWYENNIGRPFVPQAYSARAFRAKFEGLENAMKKVHGDVEVSDEVKKLIVPEVDHFGWPKGSKSQVPVTCQITLDNIIKFQKKLRKAADRLPTKIKVGKNEYRSAPLVNGVVHHLKDSLPHPREFTRQWMRDVFSSVGNWDAWSGNLTSMAFNGDLSQKRFEKRMLSLIASCTHLNAEDLWKKVKEELS